MMGSLILYAATFEDIMVESLNKGVMTYHLHLARTTMDPPTHPPRSPIIRLILVIAFLNTMCDCFPVCILSLSTAFLKIN